MMHPRGPHRVQSSSALSLVIWVMGQSASSSQLPDDRKPGGVVDMPGCAGSQIAYLELHKVQQREVQSPGPGE